MKRQIVEGSQNFEDPNEKTVNFLCFKRLDPKSRHKSQGVHSNLVAKTSRETPVSAQSI